MSKLLDDLIKQSRADAAAYEEFLKKAEELVKRLAREEADRRTFLRCFTANRRPSCSSTTSPAFPATTFQCPADDDGEGEARARNRPAMREKAPAGWKGDDTREKQVLNALFPIMSRDREATQAIFEIIKNQPGY